jgi:glucose uptake protein GlcU
MLCPVAIRFIGLGMGLILWGCTSMLLGWASGKFGLFGLARQEISNESMNYVGVFLSILGLVVYVQVKTVDVSRDAKAHRYRTGLELSDAFSPLLTLESQDRDRDQDQESHEHRPHRVSFVIDGDGATAEAEAGADVAKGEAPVPMPMPMPMPKGRVEKGVQEVSFGDSWSAEFKRVFGTLAACLAGVFFGVSFDPSQYTIDNKYDGRDNVLNYVFSHYLGILLTSWAYTVLYCIYCRYSKQQPYVSADVVLPGTLSGLIWGVAEICYFVANGSLGFPVSFPIVAAGPGFVGALYGVFYYGEISGGQNLRMLGLAMCITIPALVLVGLSH